MAKFKLSEALKSRYRQLLADYLIRNPKIPYIVSIPGNLTSIGNLKGVRFSISETLGPKCVKIT